MSLLSNICRYIIRQNDLNFVTKKTNLNLSPITLKCFCTKNTNDVHTFDANNPSELNNQSAKTSDPSLAKKLLEESTTYVGEKGDNEEEEWATKAYPKHYDPRQSQAQHSLRPKVDPRDTSIIMFPGQGTQFVGMGRDLVKTFPIARDLFEEASAILNYDLLKLCVDGPASELDKTIHAQSAVFVCSVGALEVLREERPAAIENCVATLGFSLGEITALTFSGAFDFQTAVELIKIRSEAMQLACDIEPGGMATVMYGPDTQLNTAIKKAKEWCVERGITNPECRIANYLFPHCKVIAGHIQALKYLDENQALYKIRRVRKLPVSGAFHTDLMRPAVEPFSIALRKADIGEMIIPVHSNVDGKRYRNADHIRKQLPKQIFKPVCWEQSLHVLYERPLGEYFPRTFECGPGKSLLTILKQVNRKAFDSGSKVSC